MISPERVTEIIHVNCEGCFTLENVTEAIQQASREAAAKARAEEHQQDCPVCRHVRNGGLTENRSGKLIKAKCERLAHLRAEAEE